MGLFLRKKTSFKMMELSSKFDWNSISSAKTASNKIGALIWFNNASAIDTEMHARNISILSLFHRFYFGRCSSELV